MPVLLEDW